MMIVVYGGIWIKKCVIHLLCSLFVVVSPRYVSQRSGVSSTSLFPSPSKVGEGFLAVSDMIQKRPT